MKFVLVTSKIGGNFRSDRCISFVLSRRTGDARTTVLDVGNDRHAYPALIFSRVKSYTIAADQPLK